MFQISANVLFCQFQIVSMAKWKANVQAGWDKEVVWEGGTGGGKGDGDGDKVRIRAGAAVEAGDVEGARSGSRRRRRAGDAPLQSACLLLLVTDVLGGPIASRT